jgi:hypothetical protein
MPSSLSPFHLVASGLPCSATITNDHVPDTDACQKRRLLNVSTKSLGAKHRLRARREGIPVSRGCASPLAQLFSIFWRCRTTRYIQHQTSTLSIRIKHPHRAFTSSIHIKPNLQQRLTQSIILQSRQQFHRDIPVYIPSQSQNLLSKSTKMSNFASYDEEGLVSPASMPPMAILGHLQSSSAICPATAPFGSRFATGSTTYIGDSHMSHHHSRGPSDGETVWQCCKCGDGGMSTWNSSCHSCGHTRCDYGCCVEEV